MTTTTITITGIKRGEEGMLDLHSHILPGIDDGAKDLGTALAMAGIAVGDGITTMVATPHFMEGEIDNTRELVLAKCREYEQVLAKKNLPLKIIPGTEVYLSPNIPERMKRGELMTINDTGKYLLVELPMQSVPSWVEQVMFELNVLGVTPIIAHPERNGELAGDIELVARLVDKGCLLQINGGSLTGLYGKQIKKTADHLVKQGLFHFIGSDAHSAGGRSPRLKEEMAMLERLFPGGAEYVAQNGKSVLAGEELVENGVAKGVPRKGFIHKLVCMLGI